MNNQNIIPMRIDGQNAADLTQLLDDNHEKGRKKRRQRSIMLRARIIRIVTTVIVIGIILAMVAW